MVPLRNDPMLRAARRILQALKLEFAGFEKVAVHTPLVETKEEAEALRTMLLAYARDGDDGLERIRFQERAVWRQVKAVLERAEDNGAGGIEEE